MNTFEVDIVTEDRDLDEVLSTIPAGITWKHVMKRSEINWDCVEFSVPEGLMNAFDSWYYGED
jgi:hypothetical protein